MNKRLLFILFTSALAVGTATSVSAADIDSMTFEELKEAYKELETKYNALISEENSNAASSNSSSDIPLVTYDDISSGAYNGKTVSIDAIIDNLYIPYDGACNFSLWYSSGGSYVVDDGSFHDIKSGSPQSVFSNSQDGDVIRFTTQVYDDGSFGPTSVQSAEIIGKSDLESINSSFKASCPDMNYEDVQRNPDSYQDKFLKCSGTIFQIINESPDRAEYLLECPYGYVYLSWYENEKLRGSRILEGDAVTVYGNFTILKTYDTLISQNTVPEISVVFID